MIQRTTLEDIRKAEKSIEGHILRTPSVRSTFLADRLGASLALKLEILQFSGCFKPRGITNKIMSLSESELAAGLVTVSGGNHGVALARIACLMGLRVTIVMPQTAPRRSIESIRADGANLLLASDVSVAFTMAEQEQSRGLTYIHAYDDPSIIAGHGTLGLEFITDIPDLTDVVVSIGGGALISGVATAIKAVKPGVRMWGVETVGADAMSQALAVGHPVSIPVSSIASTLGAPQVTERTLEHVRALVEQVFVVSDAEAVAGVIEIAEEAKCWVEPAAGCLVPAARRVIERVGPNAAIGLVLCGGNISFGDVAKWVKQFGIQMEA
jgi:threonine dehydratase